MIDRINEYKKLGLEIQDNQPYVKQYEFGNKKIHVNFFFGDKNIHQVEKDIVQQAVINIKNNQKT